MRLTAFAPALLVSSQLISLPSPMLAGASSLSAASVAGQAAPDAAPQVEQRDVEGIQNFSRVDATVGCGGATSAAAFPHLKEMGFRSVINLRRADEPGVDVGAARAAAARADMKYIHLPFDARRPDPSVVDTFVRQVVDPANQPVYIHCGSANRVGALWYVKRVVVDGWSRDRAVAEAEQIGLSNPALKRFADDYLSSKGK